MKFWHLFIVLFFIAGCSSETVKNLEPRPTAFGPMNQLVVIADADLWNSMVRDTFEYYFSAAYPVLPQPEPIFDLKHFTPEELLAVKERKELRNYIFLADINDTDSRGTKLVKNDLGSEKVREARETNGYKSSIGKDKWADGQLLVYLIGAGHDKLVENIQESYSAIIRRIREADQKKVAASIYLNGTAGKVENQLQNSLGVQMKIPSDYIVALDKDSTFWLRRETPDASSNIMIRKMKYEDQEQLTKSGAKKMIRNLGLLVSSANPNTYLKVNDVDLPMLAQNMTLNNYFALETRGIWELANDWMGGPFVSYTLHNPNTNELLMLFGFIYAPGEEKRQYMQQIEHVMHTVKF